MKGGEVMKLNYDCVRDIMLAIEEIPTTADRLNFSEYKSNKYLNEYSEDTLKYHIKLLKDENFIKAYVIIADDSYYVDTLNDLTFKGHEMLNNIRDKNVFNTTKEKISKTVGSASLSIFVQVAGQFIKAQLGL